MPANVVNEGVVAVEVAEGVRKSIKGHPETQGLRPQGVVSLQTDVTTGDPLQGVRSILMYLEVEEDADHSTGDLDLRF